MNGRRAFTLIELLVVISIIALLMAIMMPSLQRVRKQARAVVCQSNMHQWGLAWSMYAQEHDGVFFGYGVWTGPLRRYYTDKEMMFCPMARKTWDEGGKGAYSAWGYGSAYGSYGMNGYFYNPQIATIFEPEKHWKTPYVKSANNIPLFLDANWLDGWPLCTDSPPEYDGQFDWGFSSNMRRYCVNRHEGVVNVALADFSVRKVGLKQLWKLKWHRTYDVDFLPPVWPDWMKSFKDYE
jgi:prepilin-type N-terminal cleavage/methylation domain-containing protein